MRIGVLGSGSWGTALTQVLCDNGQDVILWGKNEAEVQDIMTNHRNTRFFGDLQLHAGIQATCDETALRDLDVYVLAVPSIALGDVCARIKAQSKRPFYVINTAKGFHPQTFERLSVCIRKELQDSDVLQVISLIGPSLADEVARRLLTTVNAVCVDEAAAGIVQQLFSNDYLRVYTNDDEIGAEIGVAIKNVMALASGMITSQQYGDNTKAALITRGLAEMTRYGVCCGGRVETYLGLCGLGDLIVTCTSPHSRNFQAGYQIGLDDSAEAFLKNNQKTVEGIMTAKSVYLHSLALQVDMPIVTQVYRVLFEQAIPSACLRDLMNRNLKAEF